MPNPTKRAAAARSPLDHDPGLLRRRRIELGCAQAEIAQRAGVSAGHLSELERGTRNPSPPLLAALARALDCTTADLMPRQPAGIR